MGQKQPNAWGLHDVYGNVWEMLQDWYGEKYYANSPRTDPKGPLSGKDFVFRGGSHAHEAQFCRSAHRCYGMPGDRGSNLGFRLALSVE